MGKLYYKYVYSLLLVVLLLFCGSNNAVAQIADFTVNLNSGCKPLGVTFSDRSNPLPVAWSWTFGNGSLSSAQNPGAIYPDTGFFDVTLEVTFSNGLKSKVTKTAYIKVFNGPVADFTTPAQQGCIPFTASFNSISTRGSAPLDSFFWDFGTGQIGGGAAPKNIYGSTGIKTVTLIVRDTNRCSHTVTKPGFITINPKPTANFTSPNNNACSFPHTLNLLNTSVANSPGNLTYRWEFDQSQISSVTHPTVQYNSAGAFDVRLIAINSFGCRDTMTRLAFVNIQSLSTNFIATNTTGCPVLRSVFQAQVTPMLPGNKYEWSISNGINSTAKDTTIEFYAPGSYSVKLKFTAPNGCKDSIVKANIINVLQPPSADFTVSDSVRCKVPLPVTFNSTGTNIASYDWDLGKGFLATNKTPVRNFTDTGFYTVRLIVKANNGCTDTVIKPNLIKVMGPKPAFRTNINSGCVPLTVLFINTSQAVTPIASAMYKFGNGKTSYNSFSTAVFEDTGVFYPKMIVTTVDGCTDSSSVGDSITVGLKPVADFFADSLKGCRNRLEVKFTNLTNTGPVHADKFKWKFGFGPVKDDEHPLILYKDSSKKYDVELIAFNKGCSDTMLKAEYIHVLPPTATFYPNASGCSGDSISFFNTSIGARNYYKWFFGDGDSSFEKSPQRKYLPGIYDVTLITLDSNSGCTDTLTKALNISGVDMLKIAFDSVVCTQTSAWFLDQTMAQTSDWKWEFSDGQVFRTRNAAPKFNTPGVYGVKYSALVNNCRFTLVKDSCLRVRGPMVNSAFSKVVCTPTDAEFVWNVVKGDTGIRTRSLKITDGPNAVTTLYKKDTVKINFGKPSKNNVIFQYSVTDSLGCANWDTDTLRILEPKGSMSIVADTVCRGTGFLFESDQLDPLSPKPHTYHWAFGDTGKISTRDTLVSYVYHQSGTYVPRLIVKDAEGCPDTVELNLNVEVKNLGSNWTASERDKPCPPFIVQFSDQSQNSIFGISDWKWTFSDGSESNVPNPVKVFTEPGKYGVSLKLTDGAGCTDSVYIADYINLGGTRISYQIDVLEGCEPLTVNINSYSSGSSKVDIKWLMGDASNIVDSSMFKHIYRQAGLYTPVAFISDSTGCQYSLSVNDTVKVYESPEAQFDYSMKCFGEQTPFDNQTVVVGSNITYLWEFEPGYTSADLNPAHQFTQPGEFYVKLTADNIEGCGSSIEKLVTVPFVSGKVKMESARWCANAALDMEFVPTGIGKGVSAYWMFDDGNFLTTADTQVSYTYTGKGVYFPRVIIENEYGCKDTSDRIDSVLVGDDFSPSSPFIYRTTVKDNQTTETVFGANNSVDFEKYIIYRENNSGILDSIWQTSDPSDTSFIHAGLNTLSNPYRYHVQAKNFCGYYSPLDWSGTHKTMELKAFTADDASYLQWNAYEGWTPLAYELYRMNAAGDFVLHKRIDASLTEAWDSAIVCNTGYYYKIKAVGPGNEYYSFSDSAGAIPNYIPFVPGNELLSSSIEGERAIEIKWLPSTGGKVPVENYLLQRSRDGINYEFVLDPMDKNTLSVTDKVDSATRRSFFYRVIVEDSCGYSSDPSNHGKTIIAAASLDDDDRPLLQWSPYEDWAEGVEYYFIEILNNNVFVPLAQIDGSKTSFTDHITDVNSRTDYCYRIIAYSSESGGKYSKSNIVCAPVVSRLFIPNAFRPDGQSENRVFRPSGMYVAEFHMKIINRWGEIMYTTNDIHAGWDGTFKGVPVPDGTYVYVIEYTGADEKKKLETGPVILLR